MQGPRLGQLAEKLHQIRLRSAAPRLAAGVGQVRAEVCQPVQRRVVGRPGEERQHIAVHVHLQAACARTRGDRDQSFLDASPLTHAI